jgi:hypothetical protein
MNNLTPTCQGPKSGFLAIAVRDTSKLQVVVQQELDGWPMAESKKTPPPLEKR